MTVFVTGGSGFVGRHLIPSLHAAGYPVRALVRSAASETAVRAAGAEPVYGDLCDAASLTAAARGCDAIIHSAARMEMWGPYQAFHQVNVVGTDNVIAAARTVGAQTLVQIGAAAVVKNIGPVVMADESAPLCKPRYAPYIKTKAISEERVRAANSPTLRTVVVRPPAIWGPGSMLLSELVKRARAGQWAWIAGGDYPFVSCHVQNVCAGALLALQRGRGGEAYFLTDGEPQTLRQFLSGLLATRGVDGGERSLPYGLALPVAWLVERAFKLLAPRREPPMTELVVRLMGQEFTVTDARARAELGYTNVIEREQGLAELHAEAAAQDMASEPDRPDKPGRLSDVRAS
ncbi:MAG: NAD-dependent epimerase/dehydratase family protein [Myxococcota bacterium]